MDDMKNNPIVEAMAAVLDAAAPIAEACGGYRRQCEEAGFTREEAGIMSVALHGELIKALVPRMFGGRK